MAKSKKSKLWINVACFLLGLFIGLYVLLKNIFNDKNIYGSILEINNRNQKLKEKIEKRKKRIAGRKKVNADDIKKSGMDLANVNAGIKRLISKLKHK
jgi:hypothetical protein